LALQVVVNAREHLGSMNVCRLCDVYG